MGRLDGKLVALDRKTGAARMDDSSRASGGELLDHAGARLLRRPRHHGLRGRRPRHARPRQSLRRRRRPARLDVLSRFRGPASRATRRGRRTTMRGSTAAASVWQTPAIDPGAWARLLLDGQRGPRLQRRRARRRQSLHGVDRRDRARDRKIPLALPAGASRHLGLRLEQSRRAHGPERRTGARARRSSRSARRAGRTSSTARRASRSSASTSGPSRRSRGKRQPRRSHSRAAILSCRSTSTSRPRDSARQRRPHLHAVRRRGPDDRDARHLGRRQLAPELVRPACAASLRLRIVGRERLHRAAATRISWRPSKAAVTPAASP